MAALQGDADILGPVNFVALVYGHDSEHLKLCDKRRFSTETRPAVVNTTAARIRDFALNWLKNGAP
jgi:hypothetical protein